MAQKMTKNKFLFLQGLLRSCWVFFNSEIVQFYPKYSSAEKKISFLLKQLSYPQKRVAKQNKNVLGVYEG